MSVFSYDFSAFKGLASDLGKIAAEVRRNERAAVRAGGMAYQRDVQRIAPVDKGQYRASIRTEVVEDITGPVALIGTPMPQARQLEFGGTIRAKNAPYLHFRVNGHWVRVKEVYQRPKPHWRPPFDNNKQKYRDIMLSILAGSPKGTYV